jgi:hypothetical protein
VSSSNEIYYKGETLDTRFTYDKARCGTTGEVFEDNIRNSTALATGTWHRIMTAGNNAGNAGNVGGTLIIALTQSQRHCYYEVKFSSCFWEESSLRVVNHHAFGTGSNMGVLKIRLQSATVGYLGTAYDIYTNNTIGANELTINLKNAYTDDDYTLVDFTPNPTDLNNGVDIKTLELDFDQTLFGGVRANRYATTISDFRFSRAGLLTASSANITGGLVANDAFVGTWFGGGNYAVFCNQDRKNGNGDYAIRQGTDGDTIINSSSGQPLLFRIDNSTKMEIASDGNITMQNDLTVNGGVVMQDNFLTMFKDGENKQARLYISGLDDNDMVLDAYTDSGDMGITFRTGAGDDRMRITKAGNVDITNDLSVAGVLHLNSDGLQNEKFMDWNYYGGRLYEFNSNTGGVNIVSQTNGKSMNWIDPYGNGIFTILNTGTGTANEVISRCPFVIDSPVRADLDMKMVCGSTFSGITENKIYLKSGNDDGGATYLQYQDGTNAVEGVEIYVKDTGSSPNRVAQFQNSIIVFFKELYCSSIIRASAYFTQQNVPICNICFGFYQRSVDNTTGLMNHAPTVDNSTANAIKWIAVPFRIKVYAISFSTDDGVYGERDYTFQPRVYPGIADDTKRGSEKKFENIDENHYEKAVFTSEGVFSAGEKIGLGLILSGTSAAEICVKLWCYQY